MRHLNPPQGIPCNTKTPYNPPIQVSNPTTTLKNPKILEIKEGFRRMLEVLVCKLSLPKSSWTWGTFQNALGMFEDPKVYGRQKGGERKGVGLLKLSEDERGAEIVGRVGREEANGGPIDPFGLF